MSALPHCYLTAVCNSDRYSAIPKIESIIQHYGTLLDFNLFSDISLSMLVEVPGDKVAIAISELSSILLFQEEPNAFEEENYYLYLNVSFAAGKGDIKHSIPEVPG